MLVFMLVQTQPVFGLSFRTALTLTTNNSVCHSVVAWILKMTGHSMGITVGRVVADIGRLWACFSRKFQFQSSEPCRSVLKLF